MQIQNWTCLRKLGVICSCLSSIVACLQNVQSVEKKNMHLQYWTQARKVDLIQGGSSVIVASKNWCPKLDIRSGVKCTATSVAKNVHADIGLKKSRSNRRRHQFDCGMFGPSLKLAKTKAKSLKGKLKVLWYWAMGGKNVHANPIYWT